MDPALQEAIKKRMKAKRKAKKAQRLKEDGGGLNLNSMMDMMTIILVFLLKSYGTETITITDKTDVPFSTSQDRPTDTITVTIARDALFIQDQEVVKLDGDGMVAAEFKKGGIEGMFISPLETLMRKIIEDLGEDNFNGELTIIADSESRYRTIAEVMRTSISVKFTDFRFAVVKAAGFRQSGFSANNPSPFLAGE